MLNGNRLVSRSFKNVLIAATAVAAIATGSGQAYAANFPEFSFNPTVFGTPGAGNLTADRISGSYYENFTITGPDTWTSSGFSLFDSIKDASDHSYLPKISGLGENYLLYSEFSATGTFSIDVDGRVHFNATGGSATLFVDQNMTNEYHTDDSDVLYGTVTNKGPGDAALINAPLKSGVGTADGTEDAHGDFALRFNPIKLTSLGTTFFTEPMDFYLESRLTGQFIDFNLLGLGDTQHLTGDDSLTFAELPVPPVPEPATLTLLGLGLVGMARRRFMGKK